MHALAERKAGIGDLALSFAPFGILLGGAIIASLTAPDVLYARTQWTVRVAMLLAAPALALLIFDFGRARLPILWRLWWTFALLAMAVHVVFAFFGMHGGDPMSVPATLGAFETGLLLTVLALWTLDVLIAWAAPGSTAPLVSLIRLLAAAGVVAATLFATFNRTGLIYWLGIALIAVLTLALVARLSTAQTHPRS